MDENKNKISKFHLQATYAPVNNCDPLEKKLHILPDTILLYI